jgi:hypothetical protein
MPESKALKPTVLLITKNHRTHVALKTRGVRSTRPRSELSTHAMHTRSMRRQRTGGARYVAMFSPPPGVKATIRSRAVAALFQLFAA